MQSSVATVLTDRRCLTRRIDTVLIAYLFRIDIVLTECRGQEVNGWPGGYLCVITRRSLPLT